MENLSCREIGRRAARWIGRALTAWVHEEDDALATLQALGATLSLVVPAFLCGALVLFLLGCVIEPGKHARHLAMSDAVGVFGLLCIAAVAMESIVRAFRAGIVAVRRAVSRSER